MDNITAASSTIQPAPQEPTATETTTTAPPPATQVPAPIQNGSKLIIIHNKRNYEVTLNLDIDNLEALKSAVSAATTVPPALQKLMLKGAILKDNTQTLAALGIKAGTKILLVGSAVADLVEVNDRQAAAQAASAGISLTLSSVKGGAKGLGEGAQEKPPHKKIIEKGPPEDAMKGFKDRHEAALPPTAITGLMNTRGEKVRLTVNIYTQELWIATASSTEKLPFGAVHEVIVEPIKDHEEYSLVSLQLGKTEQSRYFIYWLPSQYGRALLNALR